jgi:hypothetical protein
LGATLRMVPRTVTIVARRGPPGRRSGGACLAGWPAAEVGHLVELGLADRRPPGGASGGASGGACLAGWPAAEVGHLAELVLADHPHSGGPSHGAGHGALSTSRSAILLAFWSGIIAPWQAIPLRESFSMFVPARPGRPSVE